MNIISARDITLCALADFDLWMQFSAVREKKERMLLRWIVNADGASALSPIMSSSLTPCDRIGLLFGSRELFLAKICEIAQQALSLVHGLVASSSCVQSIRNTVAYLNGKIEGYNASFLVRDAASSLIPRLTIPDDAFRVDDLRQGAAAPACGISNMWNKCYFISSVVALCGSEELKNVLCHVVSPSDANVLLRLAFRKLEAPDAPSLSLSQPPLSGLMKELGRFFPPLRSDAAFTSGWQQQDAHEVMMALLEASLGTTNLIRYREVVQRTNPPPHDDGAFSLLEHAYIPSIDGKALERHEAPVSTTNILQVLIPKLKTGFSLQKAFTGTLALESVEVEAILAHEMNIGKISPEQEKTLREEAKKLRGGIPSLSIIRRLMLCGEAPPVLPIQAVRFKTRAVMNDAGAAIGFLQEKIITSLEVPYRLLVPVIGKADQPYELRSAVLHLGTTMASGHYVTCVPDLQSEQNQSGMPTVWNYYDDGAAVQKRLWDSLSKMVKENCYLIIYDKAPEQRS